jgi:hypothetical protein
VPARSAHASAAMLPARVDACKRAKAYGHAASDVCLALHVVSYVHPVGGVAKAILDSSDSVLDASQMFEDLRRLTFSPDTSVSLCCFMAQACGVDDTLIGCLCILYTLSKRLLEIRL